MKTIIENVISESAYEGRNYNYNSSICPVCGADKEEGFDCPWACGDDFRPVPEETQEESSENFIIL
jgi:hypothetical protein